MAKRKKADGRANNARPEGSYKYDTATEAAIVKLLRQHGLTGTFNHLVKTAVTGVRRCGALKGQKERVSLSLPALQQLAARKGVKFARGPRKAA
jgi:hypothetical protein